MYRSILKTKSKVKEMCFKVYNIYTKVDYDKLKENIHKI